MQRSDVSFVSGNETCSAWHFAPKSSGGADRSACIVMAHGFGAVMDAGLEPFAERFAAAGFHVVVFDYRYFGRSSGQPRQLLSIESQLDDWAAAIAFARQLRGVDRNRVALWGTSFSGGHVVVAAARDGRVAAVSSQSPMMDGLHAFVTAMKIGGPRTLARLSYLAAMDVARSRLGLSPVLLPIVGPPGSVAALTAPDAEPGYRAIVPPDFRNELCARILFEVPRYRPFRHADRLPCPILIQICDHDSVAPIQPALGAVRRAGSRAELRRYPIGHFDIYLGADFDRSVADQLDFFDRHMPER
jgi:pimeloyl-ACP methyl ester carboxylesterase